MPVSFTCSVKKNKNLKSVSGPARKASKILALPLAFLFTVLALQAASAMSVKPTVLEMMTTGKYSRANLQVINTDPKGQLPVEIRIFEIQLDKNGKVTEKEAGKNFLVFPPQQMIAPGATQNFRVQWVGDPLIKKSKSYLFSVNQLPVKMSKKVKAGVQLVFNFGVVVNVRPPKGKSGLVLVKAGVGKDAKGKTRPMLVIKNPGNIHARLSDATLRLSSGSWSEKLTPTVLRQRIGVGLVQPGKTRRFLLPIDMPKGAKSLKASVQYRP